MQRTIDYTGQETIHPECFDPEAAPRLTYPQDWQAYNDAQTNEKILFLQLLSELTAQVPKNERTGPGRPSADLGEMIFSCCVKIYLNFSSRRTESDLKMAEQLEYLSHAPHFNTILNYFGKPEMTVILRKLIEFSAKPLKQLEDKFAVDSTGFTTSMCHSWYHIMYEKGEKRVCRKCHAMSGVRTNIITSVEVTDATAHDAPLFPALVEATAKNFEMKEVMADKAYSSRKCLTIVSENGAIPFIPFKKIAKSHSHGAPAWHAMYRYFSEHREEFMEHYHLRSNAESVFSMMKRKQGSYLRTRHEVSQTNEILCKVLVHNICVLIQEMFESGIKVDFREIASDELMCSLEV